MGLQSICILILPSVLKYERKSQRFVLCRNCPRKRLNTILLDSIIEPRG